MVTDHQSRDESHRLLFVCVPMLLGCAAAAVLANGLCALAGLVLGALLMLARS